jgi:type I restriction enzyme R subunit
MVEQDFENDIEKVLLENGYLQRKSKNYDTKTGLDKELFLQFIQNSQEKIWNELKKDFGEKLDETIIDSVYNEINNRGLLDVLRKGFSINNEEIKCSYRKPESKKNKTNYELYTKNIFSVTRQLRFSESTGESIDLALFINGFLVVTAELKDQFNKKTTEDAQNQYKQRNILDRVFQFKKGALVHFAVDYFEIFMTTKLEEQETEFIPFNKFPKDESKSYPTSYLWNEIWSKDNLLDIIHNFVQMEIILSKIDKDNIKESLIFPRYHQWDVVRKLSEDTRLGTGKRYLIEHSTGSGKSKSIAWLTYALYSLHNDEGNAVFDSIVIISDRTVIIDQLGRDIKQFDDTPGIVVTPETASELGEELEKTNKILISTQQKFHDVVDRIANLAGRHFAIIVDEAQSSQGGESSKRVMEALTDLDSFGEKIMRYDSQKNLSYYAFSGTPKEKTLHIFGNKGDDGVYRPFHRYSMKQAIDEGFVLDVLKNYTTYKRYFKLSQKGKDKLVDAKKTIRIIMRLVNEDPKNITKKSQFIIEHYLSNIKGKIGGKAKVMLVTDSRKQTIMYKLGIDKYISEQNLNLKSLAAFSGSVEIDDKVYTEENLNNPEHKKDFNLVNCFTSSDYQILVVADKFRVGFDQPLLHTMYVDKKLNGVNAVQTLSRLNRKIKGKDDVCVVDFVNTAEEIKNAFAPYYTGVILSDNSDPQLLYKLYQQILGFGIITEDEIEEFWKIFSPESGEKPSNEDLVAAVSEARSRFKGFDDIEKLKFKRLLVNYVENYAYLTQIIEYNVKNLEKLYNFGRRLLPTLPDANHSIPPSLRDNVAVKYLELKKTFEGAIKLAEKEGHLESAIFASAVKSGDIVAILSELILRINQEHSGRPVTESETICVEKLVNSIVHDDEIISRFKEPGNTVEAIINFSPYKDEFNEKLAKVLKYNEELYVDIKNDPSWHNQLLTIVAEKISENISETGDLELPLISNDLAKNKESYRTTLESCKDHLWFEDRFLNSNVLTLFESVIKNPKIKTIRILTSLVWNDGITDDFLNKIKEFKKLLAGTGVTLEVKIVSSRLLHGIVHDRYVIGTNRMWALPPSGSVFDGQTSSFKPFSNKHSNYQEIINEYKKWWNHPDALEITSNWEKIKELNEKFSIKKSHKTLHDAKCSECGKDTKVPFKPDGINPVYCSEHLHLKKRKK